MYIRIYIYIYIHAYTWRSHISIHTHTRTINKRPILNIYRVFTSSAAKEHDFFALTLKVTKVFYKKNEGGERCILS